MFLSGEVSDFNNSHIFIVDVFKRFCYGERKFYDPMKEQCQVSCVKIYLS